MEQQQISILQSMQEHAHSTAREHGFWNNQSALAVDTQLVKLALITSEVGEAIEASRKADMVNLREELADIIIRILDFAEALGFNMTTAILEKMTVNDNREYMHGKQA